MSEKVYNLSTFSNDDRVVTEEMLKLTPENYHNHPEFGKLPHNAPCEDCFELIHKRTDTTKLFVKNGSDGKHYFSQATLGLVHYFENGNKMTFDPRLRKKSAGYYEGAKQGTPTFIDINQENTGFKISNQSFRFNNEVELILIMPDDTEVSKDKADWSNYSVGEEGIRIIDAWEGIDIKIMYGLDRVKTNFIIKSDLPYLDNVKTIKFSDNIILPNNHSIVESGTGYIDSDGNRCGDYNVKNGSNSTVFKIHRAFGFDNSGLKERSRRFYYELDDNFNLFVPVDWIQSDSTVYPVTIDPLVTSTATQTAGWMSFQYNGLFCGNTGVCAYNLTVPRPPNSTITGTLMNAVYESLGGYCPWSCYMQEAAYKVTSPCGTSPSAANTFWYCNTPNPGTCTAAGYDVFPELGSCLGSACSGNVTFQIRNSYCYCSSGGNCGNNCQWMPNNTWSMTLEGRTVETLGNTVTGNGSTTIFASSCAGGTTTTLDPTPQYGVPGYTYNWSTGQTSPTINVSNFTTGDIFTADVTDACSTTVTATFQVNCPLAVTLEEFYVESLQKEVRLDWVTASERNNDYFEILRSTDEGETFEKIGVMDGAGNSNEEISYIFFDKSPVSEISYYKLGIVDTDGNIEYSPIQSVNRIEGEGTIVCMPNPADEKVDIVFNYPELGVYSITLVSSMGKEVLKKESKMEKGQQTTTLNTSNLKSGVYQLQIRTKTEIHKTKLVIE
jgi:hypothetical protein